MVGPLRDGAMDSRRILWCIAYIAGIGSVIGWQWAQQANLAARIQEDVDVLAASRWRVVSMRRLEKEQREIFLERAEDPPGSLSLVVYDLMYERNGFNNLAPGNVIRFQRRPADDAGCALNNSPDCFLLPTVESH